MIRFTGILIVSAISLAGCVSPVVSTVKDTRAIPSYNVPQIKPVPQQPAKDPDAYRNTYPGRTYSLSLNNASLVDVLKLLSKESGVSIIPERGINDVVTVEAQNKKLGELLYTILKPRGYTATVENGVVLVGKPKLSTRTFRVNYLKDKRTSTSNMNVSGFSAGSVSVSTEGKSDFWAAIEDSLELMVFGTSGKGKRDSGGYIRGEDLTKVVSESKQDYSRQSESTAHFGTASKQTYATNKDYKSNASATSQLIEHPEPEALEKNLADNKLKQLLVNEIAGIIQVTDLPENLDKIASFLTDVEEGSKRQVLIQAHIMEVNLKDSYSMGIDWKYIFDKTTSLTLAQALVPTNPTNVFKISAAGSDFGVLLDAMKEQGNINMLSSPKISALNNQKAVIKLTTKQVSWVSSKTTNNTGGGTTDTYSTTPQIDEVGIFLDVTPQIGPDNSITMQIHPSVSEIKEISTSPDKTSTKPIVDIREIDTMVDAKAGETIVIAGLISDKLNETKRSIPLLGDIPYLGAVFSYNKQERTKSELVIMMTPYILNAKSIDEIRAEHEQRMQNIGGTFHLINNLGSMVTEKNSRDWIMNNEPDRPDASPSVHNAVKPEPAKPVSSPSRQPDAAPLTPVPAPASPEVRIPVTAPERNDTRPVPDSSLQQMERQQSEIKRLEREVTTAWELLNNERRKNIELSTETRQPAVAPAEPKTVKPEIMPIIAEDTKPTAAAGPTIKANLAEQPVTMTANVQTTSPTGDREQILYRSAVVAYKIGDCAESIKFFDQFLTLYPDSPFAQDAVYYRKDCADRK